MSHSTIGWALLADGSESLAAAKEEKKKAPEPEEEEDMGFSLFD